jgi:predicted nucleic acid-binding protein
MGTGSNPVDAGEPLDKERSRICRKARDYIRGNHHPQDAVPIAVLDTNIVLDWFVFRDPACAPLAAAIESGRLRWLASRWMRDEFEHVIGRGLGGRCLPERAELAALWDRWAVEARQPEAVAPATRLHCSDPQDQPFIDLALAAGADWLVSRDRALLKLARRAAARGLRVVPPAAWVASPMAG